MASNLTVVALVVSIALVISCGLITVEAQQLPPCVSKLTTCLGSLNSTAKPAEACCNGLKDVIRSDVSCLCNLYNNRESFSSLVDITKVLQLPGRCSITFNLSQCSKTNTQAPAPSTPGSTSPPPPPPPPGTPGGSNMAKVAMGGLVGLVLLATSMIV